MDWASLFDKLHRFDLKVSKDGGTIRIQPNTIEKYRIASTFIIEGILYLLLKPHSHNIQRGDREQLWSFMEKMSNDKELLNKISKIKNTKCKSEHVQDLIKYWQKMREEDKFI